MKFQSLFDGRGVSFSLNLEPIKCKPVMALAGKRLSALLIGSLTQITMNQTLSEPFVLFTLSFSHWSVI